MEWGKFLDGREINVNVVDGLLRQRKGHFGRDIPL
jgi:hypothetical protein